MKKALVLTVFFLFSTIVTFAQGMSAMGEISGTPTEKTPEKWSFYKLDLKYGLNEKLSIVGKFQSSRSRSSSVPDGMKSPSDGGRLGIAYRVSPFLGIGFSAGLQTRRNPESKELGWNLGGEIFFGKVEKNDYYMRKQFFGYAEFEKGQFDQDFYCDARVMFPLLDFVAIGGRFESDLGFGPHGEIKIPLSTPSEQKAIYISGTYYSKNGVNTTVIGFRVAVN